MPVPTCSGETGYGQLYRSVRPFLGVSTHVDDLCEEEMGKRAQAFYAEMAEEEIGLAVSEKLLTAKDAKDRKDAKIF